MVKKTKKLFAIYTDVDHKLHRIKIAEGETADFAFPKGFVVFDSEQESDGGSSGYVPLGMNGQYPMLQGDDISHLEGQLLTLCDATFTNKEQREAFKGMVKNILWDNYNGHVDRLGIEFGNANE